MRNRHFPALTSSRAQGGALVPPGRSGHHGISDVRPNDDRGIAADPSVGKWQGMSEGIRVASSLSENPSAQDLALASGDWAMKESQVLTLQRPGKTCPVCGHSYTGPTCAHCGRTGAGTTIVRNARRRAGIAFPLQRPLRPLRSR
jgi:hypothetical protein